jgi:hypothetical protein
MHSHTTRTFADSRPKGQVRTECKEDERDENSFCSMCSIIKAPTASNRHLNHSRPFVATSSVIPALAPQPHVPFDLCFTSTLWLFGLFSFSFAELGTNRQINEQSLVLAFAFDSFFFFSQQGSIFLLATQGCTRNVLCLICTNLCSCAGHASLCVFPRVSVPVVPVPV